MTWSHRLTRRTVLKGSAGLAAAALVPAGSLALAANGPYLQPVNLSAFVPGSTTQVVLAVADRYRTARATLTTWSRQADGSWLLAGGPFSSWIGGGGFASVGKKREGDSHSPTGSFGIPLAFGTKARPAGVRLPWHQLHPPYDIWVENPRSRFYNELVDVRKVGARAVGDKESAVAYPLGAFVAYNSRRVPGQGSAIFLHPSHNSPTIGCVSIPLANLTTVLSWLDPAANPRIVMGVTAELLTLGGPAPLPVAPTTPPDTAPPTSAPPATDEPAPTPTTDPSSPTPSPTDPGTPTPVPTATSALPLP